MNQNQLKAMSAVFEFNEAMQDGELSTKDLIEVIAKSVESGHEMLLIQVVMLQEAIKQSMGLPKRKTNEPKPTTQSDGTLTQCGNGRLG